MKIKITGKELKATEAIKDYVDKKIARLEKYFQDEMEVMVTIRVEKNEQIAEISVTVKGDTYRSETAHKDLYASIDKDIDILEGQIRKFKTKKEKQNKEDSIKQIMKVNSRNNMIITDEILKTKYYDIKPISPEDAKLKLQENPKDIFLTFINIETNKVNVIFKLKDGKNFGLVEPEA